MSEELWPFPRPSGRPGTTTPPPRLDVKGGRGSGLGRTGTDENRDVVQDLETKVIADRPDPPSVISTWDGRLSGGRVKRTEVMLPVPWRSSKES